MRGTVVSVAWLLLCQWASLAEAATIYVSAKDGTDAEGTGSAMRPFKTIAAAMDALAESGAESVTLLPGNYTGPKNTNIRVTATSNTVRVLSEKGPLETFLGSQRDFRIFQIGGPVRNGTTTVTLPMVKLNGTDDASTATVRDDSWSGLTPNLVVSGITLVGGSASKGGAVLAEDGVMKMLNCRVAHGGHGTFYVKGGARVLIANTVFGRNGAKRANTASQPLQSGGAMYVEQGIVHCDTCRFVNNSAGHHGGAVYALRGSVRFSNTNFTHNTAVEGGGGAVFFANTSGNSYVVNSRFKHNKAIRGGAVFAGGYSAPQFVNSSFTDNNATQIGGAVLTGDQAKVGIKRGSFVRNDAVNAGGALATVGVSMISLSLSFVHFNSAGRGGGLWSGGRSQPRLDHCIMAENTATNGGGVYTADNSRPKLTKTEISLNAAARGAALYTDDSSRPVLSDCRLKENTASLDGGALYAAFDSAPDFTETHFHDNDSHLGDPFYISYSAQQMIKFTACSVYPHPTHFFNQEYLDDPGFPEEFHVL